MKTFALVYRLEGADVFDITPKRCDKCQDRPGLDGLGRPCKSCAGQGTVETKPDLIADGTAADCQSFVDGAQAAGVQIRYFQCDKEGDITDKKWKPVTKQR